MCNTWNVFGTLLYWIDKQKHSHLLHRVNNGTERVRKLIRFIEDQQPANTIAKHTKWPNGWNETRDDDAIENNNLEIKLITLLNVEFNIQQHDTSDSCACRARKTVECACETHFNGINQRKIKQQIKIH